MPERPQYLIDRDKIKRSSQKADRDFLAQRAASSRPGQVYHTMTSLQDRMSRPGYATDKTDINQLKGLRREWNREQKYTPQGMRVSGATSPLDAQNRFMGSTETFRQGNPRAYGKMYPVASTAMKMGEYGGLLGLGVRALTGQLGGKGKEIKDNILNVYNRAGSGLTSFFGGDDEQEKEEYIAKTFGFSPSDVHPGLSSDEYIEGPGESEVIYSPHADTYYDRGEGLDFDVDPNQPYVPKDDFVEDDFGDFYIDKDTLAGPRFDDSAREQAIMDQYEYNAPVFPGNVRQDPQDTDAYLEWLKPTQIPYGSPNPQGDFARFNKFPTPDIGIEFGVDEPPALPPYEGREFGLGQFMKEMPSSRKSDWEDYLKYAERLGDMEAGYHKQKLTYDEWHNMMRRRR